MKFKKHKGSALVTVVALCAFLALITMSIMMMTTGGFTLRKQQNTRIENFYSADSGIEIAENKTIEIIDKAIDEAYNTVKEIKDNPTKPENIPIITNPGWEQGIFKTVFEEYIDINLEKNIDNVDKSSTIYDEFERADNKKISVDAVKGNRNVDSESKVQQMWKITSKFIDKDNKQREVVVNYNIETPDYGKKSGDMVSNDSILDYIMGVDGNADFKVTGNILGYGDIWVRGDEISDSENPGIRFSEYGTGTQNKWYGRLITPKNILFDNIGMNQDSASKKEANDLYAEKLTILNEGSATNQINLRDVNVRNDFIFDGEKSGFLAKNYYGIDDIDSSENPTVESIALNRVSEDKSSSIIVSSEDFGLTSDITIKNDMYVMGTSYLRLNDSKVTEYKTGESISINKISEPYTNRKYIESGLPEDDYLYKYYNPLHLVDEKLKKDNKYDKLNTVEKGLIVKNFFEEGKKDSEANRKFDILSGVNTGGNIYSSGVMYNNGSTLGMNTDEILICPEVQNKDVKNWQNQHEHVRRTSEAGLVENGEIIECKMRDFTEEVYMMGNSVGSNNSEEMFYEKVINASVASSFNWKFIRDDLMKRSVLNDKSGNPIFYEHTTFKNDDVKIFNTTKTIGELGIYTNTKPDGTVIPGVSTLLAKKINIVFNVSASDKKKNIIFSNSTSVDANSVKLPNSLLDNTHITIIVSEGDITINTGSNVAASFYTKGDLIVDTGNNVSFGNLDVPNFEHLNNIFKKLFGGIIGGVVDEGIIDQGNGENVVNSSDLLHQEKWELTK